MGQNWDNMTQFLSHFGSEKILSARVNNSQITLINNSQANLINIHKFTY